MVKIHRITLRHFSPLEFFLKLGPAEPSPSYVVSGEWTVISWRPDATLSVSADGAWSRLEAFAAAAPHIESDLPFTGGVIGTVSYDAGLSLHSVTSKHAPSQVPHLHMHRYASAVLWNGKELFVVGDAAFVSEVKKIHERHAVQAVVPPIAWTPMMKRSQYDADFSQVKQGILDGEYYQLNLTYPLVAEAPHNPRHLFAHLLSSHPAPCASYIEGDGFSVVSLSPESFVSIQNGHIVTSPIKGTRPRGKTEAEDKKMTKELLGNEKEAAELNMIVDLLRNDVGQIAKTGTVQVTGHRLLQKNPSVWHTYSTVEAELDPSFSPLEAFRNMFPGGSITGCPKVAAMREIDRLEVSARGMYTGSMLLLSGSRLESSILIRTIVSKGKKLTLGIGGGIVLDSVLHAEYEETRRKAAPFLALAHGSTVITINGVSASHDDPRIALLDASNPHAKGVFETMITKEGSVVDFKKHLSRLAHSAKMMKMRLTHSEAMIERFVKDTIRSTSALRVKLVATSRDILVSAEPLSVDTSHEKGVGVTCLPLERKKPEAKALPYNKEWDAHQQALKKGFGEALLVNHQGHITEGAYSNLFWVKKGILHTTKSDVLPGITRARVLTLAKRLRLPVRFADVTRAELLEANEVFLTKSTTGITPVLRIDRTLIGKGKVGAITKKLVTSL